jgi:hypothetical protein
MILFPVEMELLRGFELDFKIGFPGKREGFPIF